MGSMKDLGPSLQRGRETSKIKPSPGQVGL